MNNKIIAALDALATCAPVNWVHAAAALCNLDPDIRSMVEEVERLKRRNSELAALAVAHEVHPVDVKALRWALMSMRDDRYKVRQAKEMNGPDWEANWDAAERELERLCQPPASTVCGLLEPEHIVEFNFEGDWHQAKRVERLRYWQVRAWILGCDGTMGWSSWHDSDQRVRDAWHLPAKAVPSNQANIDPVARNAATRG